MKATISRASSLPLKYDPADYDLFLKSNPVDLFKPLIYRQEEQRTRELELSTCEDLASLYKEFGNDLIVSVGDDGELKILIYDDYIE